MNGWALLRRLHWGRFLAVLFFADVSALVIPFWSLGRRLAGVPEDSEELANLRLMSDDAYVELRRLLHEAMERSQLDD